MAKLYFYYSAMNAGKSTTLLQSSHNYKERGMDTLLFTPAIDNRYETGKVTSRIGLESDAIMYNDNLNIFEAAKTEYNKRKNIRCILIDEAQFLSKAQVEQLVEICHKLKVPVLAYGLRSDFLGEPFPGSKYLLAWAQELIEIKTICHCGRKATMNMRIDEAGNKVTVGNQVEIGGNDRYISTCMQHFVIGDSGDRVTEAHEEANATPA